MTPINCIYCHDQGMVELAGRTKDGYSRGSAPCNWCDLGIKVRAKLVQKGQHPLADYSEHGLADPPQRGYHAVSREEALAKWEACTHTWQLDGPPQARRWSGDSIEP